MSGINGYLDARKAKDCAGEEGCRIATADGEKEARIKRAEADKNMAASKEE